MDRSAPEYSQTDHASAAQYVTQQEVRPSNYSTTATPTSEYSVYPPSARSGSFPEHIQRPYHQSPNHSGSGGDPSIAAPSPTYATHSQYSPYAPPSQDMQHAYPHSGGLYAQPRPDWTGYGGQPTPITPGHHVFPQTPNSAPPQQRPTQVYSFVPIPGAQQHKRPRRRYEEIERMYKCGWNGCEKAYGTLNHLNAHVTMQSHGQKRTPEEFKEIRKEWKARKKEEEAQRKAEEDRQRQAVAAAAASGAPNGAVDPNSSQPGADASQSASSYAGSRQLPPLGYQPNQYPAPPSSGVTASTIPTEYNSGYMHQTYPPASPYGPPPNQQMYSQR
ncbi:c2h2 transcription factor [Grosmannia clavigera kw1407]|uniref:C2h2 transcription factor n=1 Tax=Grosmannia clavigera (strain kw1407 / UAMH 11150) TaxID=655863 RepID=F0XIW9_GROCL|nr:c2h2 transcription factor [Grosmannia clavigera kw1407]EFX02037.1 c2h2 transcription factor [Grosmannia clavigera kw1407]